MNKYMLLLQVLPLLLLLQVVAVSCCYCRHYNYSFYCYHTMTFTISTATNMFTGYHYNVLPTTASILLPQLLITCIIISITITTTTTILLGYFAPKPTSACLQYSSNEDGCALFVKRKKLRVMSCETKTLALSIAGK